MTTNQPLSKGTIFVNLVVMMAVVALVLIGVAVAVANADAGMPDVSRDLPDTGLPADGPMTPEDVDAVRFSMAPRGYRMREVDEALARLRDELAARDAEIERLRGAPADESDGLGELDETDEFDELGALDDTSEFEAADEELQLEASREDTQPATPESHA